MQNSITAFFAADNRALFGSSASAEKTLEYYTKQISDSGCTDKVVLRYNGEPRGKSLYATTDIEKGKSILTELAAFAIQSKENKGIAQACQRCLQFCNTPSTQIELLLQRNLTAAEAEEVRKAESSIASKDWIHGFSGSKTVQCRCGELYCSVDCREKDGLNGHSEICAATNPAVAAFKEHAEETNETFLLAFKVFGFIAKNIKAHPIPSSAEALQAAVWPIRVFAKDYWWNVCMPDEAEEEDPEELQRALKLLLKDSLHFLSEVFRDCPEMSPVLNVDFYGLLMGIFERNNVSIVTPSPLLPLLEHLPSPIMESILERASQFISSASSGHDHEHGHEHGHEGCHDHGGHEEGNADPFEALDALVAEGSGLHYLQATINHSCAPNAMVFKDAAGLDSSSSSWSLGSISGNVIRDGRTVIRAIKPIKAGDEITISYLDEGGHDDFEDQDGFATEEEIDEEEREWRAMSLREYGIEKCACPKCVQKP
ncbi:UNVERIFIED_CONTAM: hypothetical protein HDU68_012457 [Siphonaria sp. JEL0065]|nr:hypothetical protein HDU68_012457 [Siphonaria sp. JEL0065]